MVTPPWLLLHGHFSMVTSPWSLLHGHFSMVTPPWLLLHGYFGGDKKVQIERVRVLKKSYDHICSYVSIVLHALMFQHVFVNR